MEDIRNHQPAEVQVLACSGTSAIATFATRAGQIARDIRVQNIGIVGAWILPVATSGGVAKNQAGGVAGTPSAYAMPGEDFVMRKPTTSELPFIAAITDSGTTTLILTAGSGS